MKICATARWPGPILWLLCVLACASCGRLSFDSRTVAESAPNQEEAPVDFDLDRIKQRGVLKVVIENSSTSYFVYKGRPMGFDYELLKRYADHLGVRLQLVVTPELEEGFGKLNNGEGDILAYNLTVTNERRKRINFTNYHNLVKLVLVQRKPEQWRQMKAHELENLLIRNPIDLIGKEIVVRGGSSYISRLKNLSDEIGGDIVIVPAFAGLTTENLIEKVARGEIQYTVAEEDVAALNATYYSMLDVQMPVSLPQQCAWGVRKNSPLLLQSLNDWINQMRQSPDYNLIYRRYYFSTKVFSDLAQGSFSNLRGNKISVYDESIKAMALELDWDWKLLAAMIFKESRFDRHAKSWAGAIGLMQVMPETGERYGLKESDLLDPEKNLAAGVKYLKWLDDYWKGRIADEEERVKFVLASYNVGPGHVFDAVKLTEKYHGNTAKWDEVAGYLRRKAEPNYFNDPVAEFGYCRGNEPVDYVAEILLLYDQYRQVIAV